MKNETILITGAAGFIGSHLIKSKINQYNIIAIDDYSNGIDININEFVNYANFKFYKKNIVKENIEDIFSKYKIKKVYHFAANSDISKSRENPNIDFENTFLSTYNIILAMKKFNVSKIIFASSSAVYGKTKKPIDENFGPLNPVSHYGAFKLASESVISSFVENYKFDALILRFPNVIGPKLTHGVIYDFNNKLKKNKNELHILGNGKQLKPYLYIDDLINAISIIEKNFKIGLNVFNIGNNTRSDVTFIAKEITKKFSSIKLVYSGGNVGWVGDVPNFKYNMDKLLALGWKPTLTSNEAVIKTIENI